MQKSNGLPLYSLNVPVHFLVNVLDGSLTYASNGCAHCRRVQCVPSEQTVLSGLLLQVTEAQSLTEVPTPPQDEAFGISTLHRSRPGSTLFKSLFCLILLCSGHILSLPRIMEAYPHLSAFRGWIAFLQGELLSQTCWSVPYGITTLCEACLLYNCKPFLQSRQPPPFDLPQLSPHWLVDISVGYEMLINNQ